MSSNNNDITSSPVDEETPRVFIASGRLELLQVLGEGSFGCVFLAWDTTTDDAFYAVKRMPRFPNAHYRTQLQVQEITLHSDASDHSHVVNLHDVLEDEDFVYLIMDYCPGGDMHTTARRNKLYVNNDELTKNVFVQLIDAVHHCHERGVFHRDLKPENVLCTSGKGDSIRLADFGLATTQPTSSDFETGTESYMSPEKWSGSSPNTVCHRADDVWALGMIFFNMITGQHPWEVASIIDKNFDNYKSDPNTLRNLLPMVNKATFDVLLQILDLDPISRIQLPELRKKILNLGSIYRRDSTPPPVPPKPLHLLAQKPTPQKLQPTPAKHVPVLARLGKAPQKDFASVVSELKERLACRVAPTGDGFLIAVT